MEIFTYLILLFLLLLLLILLPIVSGIGFYKYQKPVSFDNKKIDEIKIKYQGYIPPEEVKKKKSSKLAMLKSNINISRDDIPLKFITGLTDGNVNLRKRGKKVELIDKDPSTFDFDIDELIEEEKASDLKDEQQELKQRSAKNQEELETLV